MFPFATVSGLGMVLLCVAVGWVALGVGRRMLCCTRGIGITLLAVASIVGGVVVFGSKSNHRDATAVEQVEQIAFDAADRADVARHAARRIAEAVDSHRIVVRHVDVTDPNSFVPEIDEIRVEPPVRFSRDFPFETGLPIAQVEERPEVRKEVLIALGTVLVIGGWLLFHRDRARPGALKGITVLGLAATGFILFSFFNWQNATRQITHSSDRVIKVSADSEAAPSQSPEAVAPEEKPRKAKRPARARRPIERAQDGLERARDESLDGLPPRAAEIPVAAELAKKESPPAEQPTDPVQPTEPASAPPAPEAAPESPAAPAAAVAPEPSEQAAETKPSEPKSAEIQADAPKPAAPKPATDKPAAAKPTEGAAEPSSGGRPEWVEMPGKLVGPVYRIAVKSGLYVDVPECQRHLDAAIKHEADTYIDQLIGEPGAADLVEIPPNYLQQHVKKTEFNEVVQASVGPMNQMHALLEFDAQTKNVIQDRYRQAIVGHRLWYIGSAGAVVLALLSTIYGYLRLDLQTGGAHKGRLQLAATLLALIVAAGALLVRWAVPF